jgi:aminoglycoside phosphotransferase (APT) family kinase protein
VLLRLYQRDPSAARKEYALNSLTSADLPAPRFLHLSESNPVTGHPYVLMEWIEGERLEIIAPLLDDIDLAKLGHNIGNILAGVHAITFPRNSLLDSGLKTEEPVLEGSEALIHYLRESLIDGRGGERLGADETSAVLAFAEREGRLLDTWRPPARLVHSDFGGSNILVRQERLDWRVAAILDWEFARSGSGLDDFANLLRPPLGSRRNFEFAVVEGYRAAGGELPQDWRRMSRLLDMLSWADFLSRPNPGPDLITDARTMLLATIEQFNRLDGGGAHE